MEIRHTKLMKNDIDEISKLINYLNMLSEALCLQVKDQEDFMYHVTLEPRDEQEVKVQELRVQQEQGENILRIASNVVNAYLERKEIKEPVYEHIKGLLNIFDMKDEDVVVAER